MPRKPPPIHRCPRCGKTAYPGKTSARKALRNLAIERALAVNGEKVPRRAYYDPTCRAWHLTSQPAT